MGDPEDEEVSVEVADTTEVQEGDVSTEVADSVAEMKMIDLSEDPPQEEPADGIDE